MARPITTIESDDPRAVAWRKAQAIIGNNAKLARRYGISTPAVAQWKICPPERVMDIEQLTLVPRYDLRPDIFGPYPTKIAGERHLDLSVDQAIVAFGKRKLAEALEMEPEVIDAWEKVPPELVLRVEKLTGLSRHRLRPDVFGLAPEEEIAA